MDNDDAAAQRKGRVLSQTAIFIRYFCKAIRNSQRITNLSKPTVTGMYSRSRLVKEKGLSMSLSLLIPICPYSLLWHRAALPLWTTISIFAGVEHFEAALAIAQNLFLGIIGDDDGCLPELGIL